MCISSQHLLLKVVFLCSCTSIDAYHSQVEVHNVLRTHFIQSPNNQTPHSTVTQCRERLQRMTCVCLLHYNNLYSKSCFYFHVHQVDTYHSKLKVKCPDHTFHYVANVMNPSKKLVHPRCDCAVKHCSIFEEYPVGMHRS